MTNFLSWWSHALKHGRDPGYTGLLWHASRNWVLWMARLTVITAALLLCIGSGSLMTHRLLFGQPRMDRIVERVSTMAERVEDHEQRIRYFERDVLARLITLEAVVRQNTEDIQKVMWTSMGSLFGITAFLAKELLRLLQERKK